MRATRARPPPDDDSDTVDTQQNAGFSMARHRSHVSTQRQTRLRRDATQKTQGRGGRQRAGGGRRRRRGGPIHRKGQGRRPAGGSRTRTPAQEGGIRASKSQRRATWQTGTTWNGAPSGDRIVYWAAVKGRDWIAHEMNCQAVSNWSAIKGVASKTEPSQFPARRSRMGRDDMIIQKRPTGHFWWMALFLQCQQDLRKRPTGRFWRMELFLQCQRDLRKRPTNDIDSDVPRARVSTGRPNILGRGAT